MVIGNVFARFDMKPFETGSADASIAHDFFAPFGPSGSHGLPVIVL